MKQRHVTVLASLAAVVVLIYGLLGVVIWLRWHNNSSSPTVQIVSPLPGTRLTEGDTTTLKAAVTGKDILRLELAVDGVTILAAPNPDPTQRATWVVTHDWAAESEGPHQIEALAYRTEKAVAALDSVAVEVVPPGEIAFASNRTGNYQVFTQRTDGTAVRRITDGNQDYREPAWSPLGLLALAVGPLEGPSTIWQMASDGSTQALTSWLARNRSPSWDPLGKRLAFSSDREGTDNVYFLPLNSREPVAITSERFYAGQPSWSPDGKSLALTVQRDGNWDIFRVDVDGGNLVQLTSNAAQDWFPTWSPDGDRIAFVSNRAGSHQLYLMRADGTEPYRLTNLPRGVEAPSWAPNGRWLAFSAYTGDGKGINARELYLLRAEDGHKVRLTDNAVDDTDTAWFYPPPSVTGLANPPRNGFLGEYYPNVTLSGSPAQIRLDPDVDFDWGSDPPAVGLPADYFSVRWVGRVTAPEAQDYLFTVEADAGVRLWIDGELLLDGWNAFSSEPYSVPVHLSAGDHTARLEYYENDGPARIHLHWKPLPSPD